MVKALVDNSKSSSPGTLKEKESVYSKGTLGQVSPTRLPIETEEQHLSDPAVIGEAEKDQNSMVSNSLDDFAREGRRSSIVVNDEAEEGTVHQNIRIKSL